jgi:hypothetical protein
MLVSRLICGFTVPPPDQEEVRWGSSEFLLERNVKDTTLAGCGKAYLLMKSLTAPCDKTRFLPLVLPRWGRLQRGLAGRGRLFSADRLGIDALL